ncbi:MAG TPA: hypothetical protein VFV49_13835 [Thermoanaerobaculia bacterium]|nr:hypothetical protein [Thermoanaerobaculia bacterium]
MRSRILTLVLCFAATATAQPTLVCPTTPTARPCDTFHYHVQLYRPDTKQFVELSGGNQFATQAACDRARELQVAANVRVVEYFRVTREQRQYEPDRIGPCHCDMTIERTAPNYLTDLQRTAQLRAAEEARLRVREKLLDNKLSSESEIVKGLWLDPPVTPLLAGPRLAPLPQATPKPVVTATEDLRSTNTIDAPKPTVAAQDLPLLDITAPAPPPAPEPAQTSDAPPAPQPVVTEPERPAPAPPVAAAPDPPSPEEVVAAPVEPEPAPATETAIASTVPEEDVLSAEETAERFVSYETQRIQNVLRASSAIADENVKSKIFEACMQRIQLLSNLSLLIEGSGMRSRLAAAARDAQGEPERLALIARLFGEGIRPHWAPSDAADVVFDVEPAIAAEPERALRDTTGTVTTEQKKRALYLVLAQTQPTEDQRLWLSSVVEGFLR